MGQPQREYLTVAESESLQNKALRQQARTIDTFLSIAALAGTPDADIQRGITRIRELDKPTARRYGKQLLHTLQVFDDLLPIRAIEEETSKISEPLSEVVQPVTVIAEKGVEDSEQPNCLSKIGRDLTEKLLGSELRTEEYTVEQIAQMIYDKAGRPVSHKYTQSGKVLIDPIERMAARLRGSSYESIAASEGDVTKAAVQIWFSTKFTKPIREMESQAPQLEVETFELTVLPTIELTKEVDTTELIEEAAALDNEGSAAFEGLIKANFSREEALALMECFEFEDNNPKKRREEASIALNKLQQLLVRRAKNMNDHPALPGLRMLSNTLFGQKTVFDVYLSMHKRDTQITQDDVTEILRDGTTILVNGKEHDS